MVTPIVVGIDFSPASRTALDAAARLAQDLGSRLVLTHASHAPRLGWSASGEHLDAIHEVLSESEMDDVVELATQWAAPLRAQGMDVETVNEGADPAELLLRTADQRGAGLVVVGHHGWGAIRRFLLGSVAKGLLDRATLPVLVVPHRKDD